ASVPFGGFPWGRLAFATVDTVAADLFRLVGTAGVSFAVAVVGTTLAWSVLAVGKAPVTAPLGALVPVALGAAGRPLPAGPAAAQEPTGSVTVAAVQGDVPGSGMNPFAERRVVLENHVEATHDLAARVESGETPAPDIVVWPENSTDIDPFADPTVYA